MHLLDFRYVALFWRGQKSRPNFAYLQPRVKLRDEWAKCRCQAFKFILSLSTDVPEVRGRCWSSESGRFNAFSRLFSGATFVPLIIRRVGGVTYIRFGQKIINNFHFPPMFQISIMLLYFETRAPRNQTEVTFCIFWSFVQIMEGIGVMSDSTDRPIIRAPDAWFIFLTCCFISQDAQLS